MADQVERSRRLAHAHSAAARLLAARHWLKSHDKAQRLLVVSAQREVAAELTRSVAAEVGALFGWERHSPAGLARHIAAPLLADAGLVPVTPLSFEALCARVVHDARMAGTLGRFTPVGALPGLSRALARTATELRLAGTPAESLAKTDADLLALVRSVEARIQEGGLVDLAGVLNLATQALQDSGSRYRSVPVLLLDVPVESALVLRFLGALCDASSHCLVLAPTGDDGSLAAFAETLGVAPERLVEDASPLAPLRRRLFSETDEAPSPPGDAVVLMSAAGEARECVEIARRLLDHAKKGVPFDHMAVLLRAPLQYRPLLVEAFRRAGIPAWFAQGTRRPDPAGRALLALLACAAEDVSAQRFAEYLSLGEVPPQDGEGAPPPAPPPPERFVPAEDPLLPEVAATESTDDASPKPNVPAPRRWEKLLIEAKVIGGRERWARRLDALRRQRELEKRELERTHPEKAGWILRDLEQLEALTRFALPLVDMLVGLPEQATWHEWLDYLSALAARALRKPARVYSILAELAPMGSVGPVPLAEVRLVLARRLAELTEGPPAHREGRVFVGPIDAARGLAFDVVCVPGLAERLFPQKITEDPLLRDTRRQALDASLATNETRAAAERLALRLAVGAAGHALVLSYPRLDGNMERPRVPSFYGLEVVHAAEGRLPGHDELAERAATSDPTRLGWPAPLSANSAIDEAEYDLAVLADLLQQPPDQITGHNRYLLEANPHLARALRLRARRGLRRWTTADGLVDPGSEARAALAAHHPTARPYSPTALQNYAACPYRFLLSAVHKLEPREEADPIDEISPVDYGSLVHEIMFELLQTLRADGLLPLTPGGVEAARSRMEATVERVAGRFKDDLAPTLERVWDDSVVRIKADLVEWLRRRLEDAAWVPSRFELAFGLPGRVERDPVSTDEPVVLDAGLRLRGSIDLVEQSADGSLRATDHKTGRVAATQGTVIEGGKVLQPVLYALTLEKLFPGATVRSGRLDYCTTKGGFLPIEIPLNQIARDAAKLVAKTITDAVESAFFPAAPSKDACMWCDYKTVCGPYAEWLAGRKPTDRLQPLTKLREHP
jgi:CRISPR/Cas system-associated exonuclease Cas4 (RecB family)